MAKNDGGMVFPQDPAWQSGQGGMILRDWFAGQALAGILCSPDGPGGTREDDAKWCYQMADAMLAERDKD